MPSPCFVFREGKGVSLPDTLLSNLKSSPSYVRSVRRLARLIEETQPDLILNFLEPLTGLYKLLLRGRTPVISIGHQFMMEHPGRFQVGHHWVQQRFMREFVRLVGAGSTRIALSFAPFENRPEKGLFVCPPLLRRQLFELQPDSGGDYILVYLVNHGYESDILRWHQANPGVRVHCFYDKPGVPRENAVDATLTFHALDGVKFLRMMAGCRAVVCTAGFESVCEAGYLGKPLLMIPLENHVEQALNAMEARDQGLGMVDTVFNLSRLLAPSIPIAPPHFKHWVDSAESAFLRVLNTVESKAVVEKFA